LTFRLFSANECANICLIAKTLDVPPAELFNGWDAAADETDSDE
jgi:hypothetical protein